MNITINLLVLSVSLFIFKAIKQDKQSEIERIYNELKSRISEIGELESEVKQKIFKDIALIAGIYLTTNFLLKGIKK